MEHFSELQRVEELIKAAPPEAEVRTLATVTVGERSFPIHAFILGSKDRTKPTLGLFGGVHGLERVGSQTVIAYLESLFEQWRWDRDIADRLKDVRLVTIPIVNPGGMFFGQRSNPNGVDLMRNAPVEAIVKPKFLIGGHRYSPRLPWYRGAMNQGMEVESRALIDFVKEEIFPSKASLVLDIHSGFGLKDRLWYPYAKTTETFPRIKEVEAFAELLNRSYPNHIYTVEPQALNYTTHGDLWDHLFDEHLAMYGSSGPLFIPWTLEMGSWIWVKKDPMQLFSGALSWFNPLKDHRLRRTMRRHLPLIDFFLRATKNHAYWAP